MPIVTTHSGAIDYVASRAVDGLGYPPGAVWRDCPVLTSNGNEHWSLVGLAIFDDPIRRGVPEHCCVGVQAQNGSIESAFRLLGDCGAWAQIVVGDNNWLWRPEPEAAAEGPYPFSRLQEMLDRERTRLLPSAIMHQKRHRQGYLFDRVFPITHGRLVQVFEEAVQAGWDQMTPRQMGGPNALEELCATALGILCMKVFSHRNILDHAPATGIEGRQRSAMTYTNLVARMGELPDHLKGLRAYLASTAGAVGLDVEGGIFRALSANSDYDFACLTPDMLGRFYQAALMRDPTTGELDEERRKKYGIFYTSRRITQLILDRLPIEEIPPEARFLLDPTCGSGSFLMAGEQRLTELIRPRRLSDAEKAARASAFVQGNDRDRFAILVAKLQLVQDRPDADCHYGFKEIEIGFDPRTGASVGVPYHQQPSIIVGNPPFLRHGNVEERAALFLHAAVAEWLADGGLLGFVLPATFLSGGGRCQKVRDAILGSCEVLELWDLPRNVLSDEQDGNGGTNGGDIESCVVLLRKRKASGESVSFCRVLSVDRSSEARKSFRHSGRFSAEDLCVPVADWTSLPQARWAATPLVSTLRRLYTSDQCRALSDVCRVRNGIKRSPEEPVEAEAPPSAEHVPWLQMGKDALSFSLNVWKPGPVSEYIRYPGRMRRSREKWAKRDSKTGEDLPDVEWRKRGVFAGQKILIQANFDPASGNPLRAFIDVGHYPSNNFHFVWLDARLQGRTPWTYEALLAILNAPVGQACLALARTRNNPTDLIKSIPVPRFDRESIDSITGLVSEILDHRPNENGVRIDLLMLLDMKILALYPLFEWERKLLLGTVWDSGSHPALADWTDKPWPIHGVIEEIREANENGPASIRIRVPGFRFARKSTMG